MTDSKPSLAIIILSFFVVYIVWGSTYLGNAWAVQSIPPFILAGARFVLAGIVLLGLSALFQPIQIDRAKLKNTAFAGFLLFAVGNGLVVWALQYVDSGITALIIACEPMIVALLLWLMKGKKPILLTWLGILLGLIGMGLLVGQPNFVSSSEWVWGVAGIAVAMSGWGYIAVWLPDADLPPNVLQSAAFQMIFGGLMMFLISLFLNEWAGFDWRLIDRRAWGAFWFLTIFGSIITFPAFNYLLKNVSPTKVVTSSYVHPVIALFLGWSLNNEIIHPQSLWAAGILLTSVFLINKAKGDK